MAQFKVAINGLEEFRLALRQLPQHLVDESAVIVQAQAEAAQREMDAKYAQHEWTGNLRRGLTLRRDLGGGRWSVHWILRNRAPHAYWAENGTELRHVIGGATRGRMAPLRIFIPIAMKRRRMMVAALVEIVRRAGLQVTDAQVHAEAA